MFANQKKLQQFIAAIENQNLQKEDLHDLADVHRHDEGHELLDSGVDDAALLDSGDDVHEVVVGQDHGRRALGHLSRYGGVYQHESKLPGC